MTQRPSLDGSAAEKRPRTHEQGPQPGSTHTINLATPVQGDQREDLACQLKYSSIEKGKNKATVEEAVSTMEPRGDGTDSSKRVEPFDIANGSDSGSEEWVHIEGIESSDEYTHEDSYGQPFTSRDSKLPWGSGEGTQLQVTFAAEHVINTLATVMAEIRESFDAVVSPEHAIHGVMAWIFENFSERIRRPSKAGDGNAHGVQTMRAPAAIQEEERLAFETADEAASKYTLLNQSRKLTPPRSGNLSLSDEDLAMRAGSVATAQQALSQARLDLVHVTLQGTMARGKARLEEFIRREH